MNRKSASSPLLQRPAPAPYFHSLFLIFQIPPPPGEVFKIHSPTPLKKGGVQTMNSIVSLLLYWEFATPLCSSCIILVSKCELNILHCCNFELTLYFDQNSLNFSSRLLSFILISLTKLQLISKFSNELFFTHIFILTLSQNHIKICRHLWWWW